MRNKGWSLIGLALVCFALFGIVYGEEFPATVRSQEDYKDWGWGTFVMDNGLITVAVVPDIGARVMQYDLDGHPSIYVNPDELGKVHTPSSSSGWPNYGGFKNWPAPQDRWGWPPPPMLDFGAYKVDIVLDSPDSCVVSCEGPVEQWKTAGLRFIRRLTIYRGSSRVRVEQTLINDGETEARWSVWDITQAIVNHPGEEDWTNFWVYFPIKTDSKFGKDGFQVMTGSETNPQWKAHVAEGIAAVQYDHNSGAKIGSDSDGGWVAYVDERDGYTYAKKFSYFEGAEYPDDGSPVEVYTSNGLPYLEVEVLSPLVDLTAGASYTFTEDWYAAQVHGPILELNEAGAIRNRLRAEADSGMTRLTGTYGVFYVGAVEIVFQDPSGHITGSGGMLPVSPAETFVLDRTAKLPSGTGKVVLELINGNGELMGILDVLTLEIKTGIHLRENDSYPAKFGLRSNLPNPFNPSTTIVFDIPENRGEADVRLVVYDSLGQSIRTLVDGRVRSGTSSVVWGGRNAFSREVSSGVYLCQLRMGELVDTKKMVLVR
ncbi:MAG: hypothetical protein J7M27_10575 [Candidatus Latescibacteria bacterium]|nr:hypothetical protein [Candidatus Latescibacterota bacterium]